MPESTRILLMAVLRYITEETTLIHMTEAELMKGLESLISTEVYREKVSVSV